MVLVKLYIKNKSLQEINLEDFIIYNLDKIIRDQQRQHRM